MPDYAPPFAPHVCGVFPDRIYDEDRQLLPASIAVACGRCGESAALRCDSGRYRDKVAKWALLHVDCERRGKIEP